MKILIVADIEASGEWIALQSVLAGIRMIKPKYQYHLIAFGSSKLLLKDNLFTKILFIKKRNNSLILRKYVEFINECVLIIQAIKKISAGERIDIVISTLYLPVFLSKIIFRKKVIFFFQGLRYYSKQSIFQKLYKVIFIQYIPRFIEKFSLIFADLIVVPSDFAKELVIRACLGFLNINKVHIIPNIIDKTYLHKYKKENLIKFRRSFNIPLNKKLLIFCGVIRLRKRIFEIVNAYSKIHKSHPNMHLIIAYLSKRVDEAYFKTIRSFIKENRLNNKISFIKDLKPHQLAKLYQTSTLAVNFSPFETYCNFLSEAYLSGLPILTTRVGFLYNSSKRYKNINFLDQDSTVCNLANSITNRINKISKKKYIYPYIKTENNIIYKRLIEIIERLD